MSLSHRRLFYGVLMLAFAFGFFHHAFEGHFERLHIFLFNLCSGGTLVLWYTQNESSPTLRVKLFFAISFFYAFLAFKELYKGAILLACMLAWLVYAHGKNSFHFHRQTSVEVRFQYAALAFLIIGLLFSAFAMVNVLWLHLAFLANLSLNSFFLVFSFPISLMTFSIIFNAMELKKNLAPMYHAFFWLISIGVVIFFLFILKEMTLLKLLIALLLALCVLLLFYLFFEGKGDTSLRSFLLSGLGFLIITALSGVAYIVLGETSVAPFIKEWHRIVSLLGWNLTGMMVMLHHHGLLKVRYKVWVIALHWVIVLILTPLGYHSWHYALLAFAAYSILLKFFIFQKES